MADLDAELREARNNSRVAEVRGAYLAGLRGADLRKDATDAEQRAHAAGRERRSLHRERARG